MSYKDRYVMFFDDFKEDGNIVWGKNKHYKVLRDEGIYLILSQEFSLQKRGIETSLMGKYYCLVPLDSV